MHEKGALSRSGQREIREIETCANIAKALKIVNSAFENGEESAVLDAPDAMGTLARQLSQRLDALAEMMKGDAA